MEKNYKWPFETTNSTTLQWFQSRINHNILATNKYLHKIKLINNPTYSFCAKNLKLLNICCGAVSTHKKILYDFKHWCESNNITLNIHFYLEY